MARKIEQVQSELNSLPSGGSINIHNDTPQKQAARREARQKRRTLEQELVQLQGTGNYQTGTVTGAAQTAMEETQRRAMEDREQALAEIRAGKSEALGDDYGAWKGVVSDLPSKQLGSDYEAWKQSIQDIGTGEYGEDIKEQMHAKSVIPIESQTQQMIKDIQRSYYGGGTPGGMQQMMTQQAKLSGIGQAGGLRRDIEIASEGSRQAGLGKQSSALGQLAQYRGGISTGTSSKLADILGHTITAVPDYSKAPAVTSAGGGTTTTSGGGVRRSTTPRKRTTPNFETVKMWGG